jgi:hypothetical protein
MTENDEGDCGGPYRFEQVIARVVRHDHRIVLIVVDQCDEPAHIRVLQQTQTRIGFKGIVSL